MASLYIDTDAIFSLGAGANGTASTIALSAAYVHGTSGPAATLRFEAVEATTLNKLLFFRDGHCGHGREYPMHGRAA